MSQMKSVRVLVTGRVQGVGFRYSTKQMAASLGITGHARNLADGRVEVEAHGSPTEIAQLLTWLRQGSEYARVEHLQTEEITGTVPAADRFITL
ncbi:acylphosphatase [Gynuella sunshinyii]|uniref:acylphosphatase n=1 Tax=Gynuella sunshinyii YC6258 TaxID=1445510 RepID=A0A0C5VWE7_9GAMM|nr:acylphosphatase [Gynuella sunshinyii]AJQ97638.1 acylphosphatase [Gynuella sunshinyii YC6258]